MIWLATLAAISVAVFCCALSALAQTPLKLAITKTESAQFPTVNTLITVADERGRPVPGLTAANFQLTEDGRVVEGLTVNSVVNDQEPLRVVLVIDSSGSMLGEPLSKAQAAAVTFVNKLNPIDTAAVISFADKTQVVQRFTGNKQELVAAINGMQAAGETAFHDGVLQAAQTAAGEKDGRRIVVALTDGEDTKSTATLLDAISALQHNGVPAFTVALGHNVQLEGLERLATSTGGVALFAPSAADLEAAFSNIADQLRNQYQLSFRSSVSADGKKHTLAINVRHGDATVAGQTSFVATNNPPQIRIISPQADQKVMGTVPVRVEVKAVAPVRRVEASVAGVVVGSDDSEPYELNWDTSKLAVGNHNLDVTVTDTLGNRATARVRVRVDMTVTPVVQPEPTAAPVTTSAPRGLSNDQLFTLMMILAAFLLLFLIVARRRRLGSTSLAWRNRARGEKTKTCPSCGKPQKGGRVCEECAAADAELIRKRLGQLVEDRTADETEGERS